MKMINYEKVFKRFNLFVKLKLKSFKKTRVIRIYKKVLIFILISLQDMSKTKLSNPI